MLRRFALLALFLIPIALAAQPSIAPPALGYLAASGELRPISGVPGAALLDGPLPFGPFERSAIAPNGRFAIVGKDGQTSVLNWNGELKPVQEGLARVEFSPAGTAAALISEGRISVWTNLEAAPSFLRELAVEGEVAAAAVSDDALTVAWSAGGPLMVAAGSETRVAAAAGEWSAIAFLRGSADFAAADRSADQVILFREGQAIVMAGQSQGIADPAALAFSLDNRRLIAANARSGSVTAIGLETGESSNTSCDCRPDGLFRLRGNAVFRLTEGTKTALVMFDGDGPEPRVVPIAGGEQ